LRSDAFPKECAAGFKPCILEVDETNQRRAMGMGVVRHDVKKMSAG
jgi:hypothetical protein